MEREREREREKRVLIACFDYNSKGVLFKDDKRPRNLYPFEM